MAQFWGGLQELNPQDSDSLMNKGNLLCDLGHADEGLTCYNRALEINPGDAQGWIKKGATLADAGRNPRPVLLLD
jgi:tetratricopeptide (TPR) repeat protein